MLCDNIRGFRVRAETSHLFSSSALWVVQALGIALKLTYEGSDQLWHLETAYCVLVRTQSPDEKKGFWTGFKSRNTIR